MNLEDTFLEISEDISKTNVLIDLINQLEEGFNMQEIIDGLNLIYSSHKDISKELVDLSKAALLKGIISEEMRNFIYSSITIIFSNLQCHNLLLDYLKKEQKTIKIYNFFQFSLACFSKFIDKNYQLEGTKKLCCYEKKLGFGQVLKRNSDTSISCQYFDTKKVYTFSEFYETNILFKQGLINDIWLKKIKSLNTITTKTVKTAIIEKSIPKTSATELMITKLIMPLFFRKVALFRQWYQFSDREAMKDNQLWYKLRTFNEINKQLDKREKLDFTKEIGEELKKIFNTQIIEKYFLDKLQSIIKIYQRVDNKKLF